MSRSKHPVYSRPETLDRLDPDRHHVIEASAGTGKTFTIEHLVVDKILREGIDISQMLVVTFTERAAAELRARIRGLLAKLLALRPEPTDSSPTAKPEAVWVIDDEARQRLSNALLRIDQAAISTIHSFCQRLLTENAFAHRRLFAQRLMDGREIFTLAFHDFLREKLAVSPEFVPLLRTRLEQSSGLEESAAVTELEGTLYEAMRCHGRIEPALDETAAEAALKALPRVLPSTDEVWTAYKQGKGRKHEKTIRRIWDEVIDRITRAREATGALRLWTLAEFRQSKDTVEEIASVFAHAALPCAETLMTLVTSVPPQTTLLIHLLLAELRDRVKALKAAQGLYDFDDMLSVVAESLEGPTGATIVETLRQRYRYALIDEFQDTDPVQWNVFRRVFVDEGSESRLLVIGDPKQAIYGFRAADVETYLRARVELCETSDSAQLEKRIVRLRNNFRSSKRMIDAYNLVLSQTPTSGAPLFAHDARITYGPEAEVSCGDDSIRLMDGDEEAAPIHLVAHTLEGKSVAKGALLPPVAQFIAEEVERLLASNMVLTGGKTEPRALRASDIFVLTRDRADGLLVAEQFAQRGIPHAFYKRDGLFKTEEVSDLLDVLEAVQTPDDSQRRSKAWLTPFFGLSLDEVSRAHALGDESEYVARLRQWSEHAARRDFRTLFTALVDESGLARRVAFLGHGEAALANTLRVLDLLLDEARRRHATLGELIERLRAYRAGLASPPMQDADIQPVETDQPAVQIMTMHASKGLEAPVVFLIGGTGSNSRPPYTYRDDDGERCLWFGSLPDELKAAVELEQAREDERLLYVALTRAKVRQYLPLYLKPSDGGDREPALLDGMYGALNTRLFHLLEDSPPSELFELRELEPSEAPVPEEAPELQDWKPSVPLALPDEVHSDRRELVRARRGGIVTSYTALSRHSKAAEPDREDVTGETWTAPAATKDPLTSSAVVGIFLHDALEALRSNTSSGWNRRRRSEKTRSFARSSSPSRIGKA